MFLFKKTKNIVKRIAMNMTVYGFAGVFVLTLPMLFLPASFSRFFAFPIMFLGFTGMVGTLLWIGCSLAEPLIEIIKARKPKQKNILVLHNEKIYIEKGKLLCNGREISVEQAREKEKQYVAAQAYLSVAKYGTYASFEEANDAYGYVHNADGTWSLKEYEVDKYVHKIKKPENQKSINGNIAEEPQTVIFEMSEKSGPTHLFTYSGHTRYDPNRSSMCGYGSDDWYYLCKENNVHYLLMFSDCAESGTNWMATKLLDEDYEKLVNTDVSVWRITAYSKERKKLFAMRLTNIDSVRHLLPQNSRCCGKLTDRHYSGVPDSFEEKKAEKRPPEPIIVKKNVDKEIKSANGAAFSFEKQALIIDVVHTAEGEFVRITDYECHSGANGRPLYSLSEYYYSSEQVDTQTLSVSNYKRNLAEAPLYRYTEYGDGVKY